MRLGRWCRRHRPPLLLLLLLLLLLVLIRSRRVGLNQVEFDSLMASRVKRLREGCDNSSRPNIKTGHHLYPLLGRSLVWCPVYKAASTNWMYNLLPLAGLGQEEILEIRERFNWRVRVDFSCLRKYR